MENYTPLIEAAMEKAVLEAYKSTPEYQTALGAMLSSLGVTVEQINNYINAAVEQGVSADTALQCYILTVQKRNIKWQLIQNQYLQ